MAAPAVAIVAAFLTGAPIGAYGVPWLAGAARVEAGAAIGYADLQKACPIAEPLADAAARARPNLKGLARFAALTDMICADVALPDTPANQIKLAADVVDALHGPSMPTPTAPGAPSLPPPRLCGRSPCS